MASTEIHVEDAAVAGPAVEPVTPKVMETQSEITIHHLNNSRSQRLFWLLEELEVPYNVKEYKRNTDQRAPKELTEVHPLGKAPILTDGSITLAESGAIIEYIIFKYGEKLRPKSDTTKITDLYFTHYAEGTLMPIIITKYTYSIIPQKAPFILKPILKTVFQKIEKMVYDPDLKKNVEYIETHLKKQASGWFAGEEHPTAADFMMIFSLELLVLQGNDTFLGELPEIKKYLKRVHERPAYKKAMENAKDTYYAKI